MKRQVFFISTIASLAVISATLCAPALPIIKQHFSSKLSILQFVITLFMLGNAFGQLIFGPLSDRIGQKKVLMGGLVIYTLSSLCCALSNEMFSLIACRFIQGFGSAAGPVLARAIAAGRYPTDLSAKVKSYGAIAIGLSSILALLFSGQASMISWRASFVIAAVFGLVLLIWSFRHLEILEAKANPEKGLIKGLKEMKEIILTGSFFKNALPHAMTHGVMYGYIIIFPFAIAQVLKDNNPNITALASGVMIVFYMIGAYLASFNVERFGSYRVLLFGVAVQLLSGVCMLFLPPMLVLVAIAVFNVSIGVILPVSAARALNPFSSWGQINQFKTAPAVGAASSCLGLVTRFLSSFISMAISQMAGLSSFGLGLSIVAISLISGLLIYTKKEVAVSHG